MKLTVLLQTRKGEYVYSVVTDFAGVTCLSDAAQQMPRFVIPFGDRVFGFHGLGTEDSIIFRERTVMSPEGFIAPEQTGDKTIRQLQTNLPWTGHYHRDFRNSPMTHKDFAHALLHVYKAGGKLATIINDAEHAGIDWTAPDVRELIGKMLADFVICALRMANTCPEGVIDLQRWTEDRIEGKNNLLASDARILAERERQ